MSGTVQFSARPTNNQQLPSGNPKFVRIPLDFTGGGPIAVDLSSLVARGYISQIQCAYIDNSGNNSPIVFTFGNPVAQTLTVPGLTQGFYPVICPDNNLTAFSTGGVAGPSIALLNVPIAPMHWSVVQATNVYDGNGFLKTADQNIAPAVAGNKVVVSNPILESLFAYEQNLIARSATIAPAATSALDLLAQAATWTSFTLDSFDVSLSTDAVKAAAGLVTVSLKQTTSRTVATGGLTLWSKQIYVPAAAGNTPGVIEIAKREKMNYRNTTGAAAYLHLLIDNALTGGTFTINIAGNVNNVTS
jgi:hypothetical protein